MTVPLSKNRNAGFGTRLNAYLKLIWSYRLSYLFIAPFVLCFLAFIFIPVVLAILLSFTYFNALQPPRFVGWQNYLYLLSQDLVFLKNALPNTIKFVLAVGPGGYIASFILAWLISQLPNYSRTVYALIIYSPSLVAGAAMTAVWVPLLMGDRIGYINSVLLSLGLIDKPVLWVTDAKYLMGSMVAVTLWSSMGVGFLAQLAGVLNVNKELYEAGRIDGVKSRLQEIWYITIPSMKPQMLFSAVMAIVGSFKAGEIGQQLSGQFPTPQYSGHVLMSHIQDYGEIRFEMGYASAISVFLLVMMYLANKLGHKLFGSRGDE
ncbi:carbohydrate ABC transporter permease [Paenibacillus sp. GYB003]|uniref:carbohydrate ABC transporter permease n=1 Tax=Paenibacillus sp. GYB003 TaxID=2994392 RepID=UPI002F961AD0